LAWSDLPGTSSSFAQSSVARIANVYGNATRRIGDGSTDVLIRLPQIKNSSVLQLPHWIPCFLFGGRSTQLARKETPLAPQIIVAHLASDPGFVDMVELAEGAIMTTLQASLFGAMLAWTPSLLVLACIVRDIRATPREELD
jgi:hypothetical protein